MRQHSYPSGPKKTPVEEALEFLTNGMLQHVTV